MLKKRVIPILLYKNGRLVKGVKFGNFRETGQPRTAIRVYSSQDADELLLINISNEISSEGEFYQLIEESAEECSMPLTIGGGVSTVKQISKLLRMGADKVLINSSIYNNYHLIKEATREFGSQAVTIGIDLKLVGNDIRIVSNYAKKFESVSLIEHTKIVQDFGAGELLLTSVDNDGLMGGYDFSGINKLKEILRIPVIVAGGIGNFRHLAEALNHESVSGVGCGSLFHFGDNNPIRARSFLRNQGIPMRQLK